jgi:hypothetical protein
MPITGTDDLAGYFIFYFIFHFSKMRSWGLSFGSRGGMRELHDRPCRWMEFHTNTPRLVFFLSVFLTYSFLASLLLS